MIVPRIVAFDVSDNRIWETTTPRGVEILAPFGAMDADAKVTLDNESGAHNLVLGAGLEIYLDDTLKFRGEISELRTHSAASPLVVRAARRPERMYQGAIRKLYEDATPTEILADILDLLPGSVPAYSSAPASPRTLDRLDFRGTPLFYAVDLLAKLAGNWLWWIDWEGELHLIPPDTTPEHVWYFDPDRMILNPWLVDRSIKNLFFFQGGVSGGTEFVHFFEDLGSRDRFGDVEERLYARAISTEQPYEYLKEAVLQDSPWPTNYRSIDRYDETIDAFFGERFELRGNQLLRLDQDQVYRIAAEEIEWSEDSFRTRYHLAEGLESATRYTRYLDHDPLGTNFVSAHLGAFALDLSAFDSETHLDP
jgi:hypothetical protein